MFPLNKYLHNPNEISATLDQLLESARNAYIETFQTKPAIVSIAPGRVNMIGEHVDYNDGFVLPMALPLVTLVVGSSNSTPSSAVIKTYCDGADDPKTVKFDLRDIKPSKPKWANYIKGVISCFKNEVPGFNAIVVSNVPIGSGLSSSAALEVSTITFIEELTGQIFENPTDKALLCQKAEHSFVNMPCGIMDQLVSLSGRKNHFLLIDCRSLETFQIPFKTESLAILICDSKVRHELSNSEYSTRRDQCAQVLKLMKLSSYRDATLKDLEALPYGDIKLKKRAKHVISEIIRTSEAANALKNSDFQELGRLMIASHKSLRDEFEVSCPELDLLVDAAIECDGVLGSRMTGGGFGGCTVTLLDKSVIERVACYIRNKFKQKYAYNLEFYVCIPSDGARLL